MLLNLLKTLLISSPSYDHGSVVSDWIVVGVGIHRSLPICSDRIRLCLIRIVSLLFPHNSANNRHVLVLYMIHHRRAATNIGQEFKKSRRIYKWKDRMWDFFQFLRVAKYLVHEIELFGSCFSTRRLCCSNNFRCWECRILCWLCRSFSLLTLQKIKQNCENLSCQDQNWNI